MRHALGIDAGSVATKAVLFTGGQVVATLTVPTGFKPAAAAVAARAALLKQAGLAPEEVFVCATGYGRVGLDFADKTYSEITCHARGAYWLDPAVRTVIDIGGQDSKAISLNDAGAVRDFLMNDKCAAGSGKFLQVSLHSLGEEISNLDQLTQGAVPQTLSSTCTVFAESEVIGLLANGCSKESIALGLVHAIVQRTVALVSRLNLVRKVCFTGGLAQSQIMRTVLAEKLGVEIEVFPLSPLTGALGAALLGWQELLNANPARN